MDGVKPSITQYSQPDWHIDAGQPAVEKEYRKYGVSLTISETPYLINTLSFEGKSVDLDSLDNNDIEVLSKHFDVIIYNRCTVVNNGTSVEFTWSSGVTDCSYELQVFYFEEMVRVLEDLGHEIEIEKEIILEYKE